MRYTRLTELTVVFRRLLVLMRVCCESACIACFLFVRKCIIGINECLKWVKYSLWYEQVVRWHHEYNLSSIVNKLDSALNRLDLFMASPSQMIVIINCIDVLKVAQTRVAVIFYTMDTLFIHCCYSVYRHGGIQNWQGTREQWHCLLAGALASWPQQHWGLWLSKHRIASHGLPMVPLGTWPWTV